MLCMCIIKYIPVVFQSIKPYFNEEKKWCTQVVNKTNDIKMYSGISPQFKIHPNVEGLWLYYYLDIAICKGCNVLANQK